MRVVYSFCVIMAFVILFYVVSLSHFVGSLPEHEVEQCVCVTNTWVLPHREEPSFECEGECPEWYVIRTCSIPGSHETAQWKHHFFFGDVHSVSQMEAADSARGGVWTHSCVFTYNETGHPVTGYILEDVDEEHYESHRGNYNDNPNNPYNAFWDGVLTITLIVSIFLFCLFVGLKRRYELYNAQGNVNYDYDDDERRPVDQNLENIVSYNTFAFHPSPSPYPSQAGLGLGYFYPPAPGSGGMAYPVSSYPPPSQAYDPRQTNIITSYPVANEKA